MYSAMSPAKLRLAQSTHNSLAIYAKMYGDSYTARTQDEEEFYSKSNSESTWTLNKSSSWQRDFLVLLSIKVDQCLEV
jgi:hypothetical protein